MIDIKKTLSKVLNIDTTEFTAETPLLGALPEFDSMAIMTLLIELESQCGFTLNDIELEAEQFETVGTLQSFLSAQTV